MLIHNNGNKDGIYEFSLVTSVLIKEYTDFYFKFL